MSTEFFDLNIEPGNETVLAEFDTCTMTLSEVVSRMEDLRAEMPDCDIRLDGDMRAIVIRKGIQGV